MTARPVVTIQSRKNLGEPKEGSEEKKHIRTTPLPSVFSSPIRLDLVNFVFTNMHKNRRQAYAVHEWAGHQTAAESWGTGRAVARIPRVPGSGTSRSGQGAFGNMCRKGRMFAPTKTWRRWHRKISKGQRRYATCSALAATSVPSLVLARGHRIEQVPEIPFVVDNEDINQIKKTKEAVAFLKAFNLYDDIVRVKESHKVRKGSGKYRNRRHVERKGPLIVYINEDDDNKVPFAFRNIPGVELCHVSRLNLLQLAPGGHLGRFVIWVEDAFKALDKIFGTFTHESQQKKGFYLPHSIMTNTDLSRIINSDEIQSHLRPKITQMRYTIRKKNPLKNLGALVKLNPYALTQRRRQILQSEKSHERKRKNFEKKRAGKWFKQNLFGPMAILPVEKKYVEETFDEYIYHDTTVYEESEEEEPEEKKEEGKEGEGEGEGKEGEGKEGEGKEGKKRRKG